MRELATVTTWVAALVLASAGVAKLRSPRTLVGVLRDLGIPATPAVVRAIALTEIAIAGVALVVGGVVGAAGLSLSYAVFAVVAWRRARSGASCGCLGARHVPTTALHVAVDAVAATAAFAVATTTFATPAEVFSAIGVPSALLAAIAVTVSAWLVSLAFTAAAELAAARSLGGRP